MHNRNFQKVVIESHKVFNGLRPEIMNEVFQFQIQNHYNLLFSVYHLSAQYLKVGNVYPI